MLFIYAHSIGFKKFEEFGDTGAGCWLLYTTMSIESIYIYIILYIYTYTIQWHLVTVFVSVAVGGPLP